jgi:Methyltransferase domain
VKNAYARLATRIRRKREWTRRQRHGLAQYPSRYLNWMDFANAGMLHTGHRFLIDIAVRELPTEDPVVEIGAFCGLSTNVITYFLDLHGRRNRLFSADPWVFEGEGGETLPDSPIAFSDYRRLVREQFERNVRFWSAARLPHSFQLASDEFFSLWRAGATVSDIFGREARLGGAIAFCFIDGDHAYEQAERDFLHADEFLAPGGYVLVDDSDEFGAFPQLHELVQEARRRHGYELVAANPHHLLRKPF